MATPVDYEIPRYGADTSTLLGWCLSAQLEGAAWLGAQQPATGWAADLQMLSAPDGSPSGAVGTSNVGYNKGKRVARELVASLSQFRHEGEVKPAWDQTLYDQAHMLTDLDEDWYRQADVVMRMREGLQYAVGLGTSYLWETWDRHFWGPGKGDIRLAAVSPANVTFVQLPADHDIQRAYATIVREEVPLNLARAIYGPQNSAFASALVPDRDSPGWVARGWQKVQQFISPMLRVAGLGRPDRKDQRGSYPTVDIFHMYTVDSSINETPFPIQMGPWRDGKPATNWSYEVPALGDPIPLDRINPETQQPFTRPATREDCKLFPRRRYTIFSRTGIAYDGPASAWHGQTPVARLRFNDWAWESLGSSLVGESRTMQEGIVALMRLIEDSAAGRLDPPAIYDDTKVDETWAQAFNPRKAGARAGADLSSGAEIIKYPFPAEYFNVPAFIPDWIRQQEARIDYMTGVQDLTAIAKAQQIPGADTLEKLMEMAGPIVQDLIRCLEVPLRQLGEWRIAYYFQYYTTPRMISVTGLDGMELEIFKSRYPETQIPDSQVVTDGAGVQRLRGDLDVQFQPDGLLRHGGESPSAFTQRTGMDSPSQRFDRQRRQLAQFRYHITESGINAIHRMTQKLFYTQLMKLGFPLDWWTFAKIAQIPNFGPPPQGTNTVMERWQAQKRMEIEQQVILAAEAQQAAIALGLAPAGGPAGGPSSNGAGGGGAPGAQGNGAGGEGAPTGGQPGAGREPSFNAPPRLRTKEGGRSTITTS